jgi:hypothetical protein
MPQKNRDRCATRSGYASACVFNASGASKRPFQERDTSSTWAEGNHPTRPVASTPVRSSREAKERSPNRRGSKYGLPDLSPASTQRRTRGNSAGTSNGSPPESHWFP